MYCRSAVSGTSALRVTKSTQCTITDSPPDEMSPCPAVVARYSETLTASAGRLWIGSPAVLACDQTNLNDTAPKGP